MGFTNWNEVPEEHNRQGVIHQRLFGRNVQVQKLTVEPGGEPVHLHNHPETEQFFLIQEGEWEFTLEEEKRQVGPGDVIYIPPGMMHSPRLLNEDRPGWLYEIYQPIWSTKIAEERKKAQSG